MIFFIFFFFFNFCLNACFYNHRSNRCVPASECKNTDCSPHDTYEPDPLDTISGWLRTEYYHQLLHCNYLYNNFIFSEAHIALTDNKKKIDTKNCDIFIRQALQEITQNIVYIRKESKNLLKNINLFFFKNGPVLTWHKKQNLSALLQLKKKMKQEKKYIFNLCGRNTHTEQDVLRIFRPLKYKGEWFKSYPPGTDMAIIKENQRYIIKSLVGQIGSILCNHLHWRDMETNDWIRFTPHLKKYQLPWYHPRGCQSYLYYPKHGPFFREALSTKEETEYERSNFTGKYVLYYSFNKDSRTADKDIKDKSMLYQLPETQRLKKIRTLCFLPAHIKVSWKPQESWSPMKALLNSDLYQNV
ncbi:MAG TPA: hypothetical protein VEK38_01625 [Candidatus Bathyarchaeia archaeon]|nr:hypothetical protein [Candidatus Bathyarchaeia archaeon]